MKYVKYGWTVVVNCFTLYVLLSIFSHLYDPFQQLVVALLVLIYLVIITFTATWGHAHIEQGFALLEQFHHLETVIKKPPVEDEQEYKNAIKASRDFIKPHLIKRNINLGFLCVFWIIAIYHILVAFS